MTLINIKQTSNRPNLKNSPKRKSLRKPDNGLSKRLFLELITGFEPVTSSLPRIKGVSRLFNGTLPTEKPAFLLAFFALPLLKRPTQWIVRPLPFFLFLLYQTTCKRNKPFWIYYTHLFTSFYCAEHQRTPWNIFWNPLNNSEPKGNEKKE